MHDKSDNAAHLSPLARHRALTAIWEREQGFRGWLRSVSHSDIGLRFMVAAFVYLCVAGVLSMLIRAQLATPNSAFAGPKIYAQIFTMHGSLMMFMFAIPMFEGLAIYVLPKMLGSRDVAFPRLSAFGWWCYFFGGLILLAAMLAGIAPDGGWFMYTPLSEKRYSPGINADIWLLGVTFVEVSAVCAAIEIIVSVLLLRAPGMSLDKMPLFAWYMLVTGLMMAFGFPPLILGSILLEVERAFDWPFFDVARGGAPLLWQHLFWLFGHPEVYIIFLPAAGVLSTIIPTLARNRILGYGWIVGAIFSLAFLSFGLWVHHMFATGIPHMALAFFSAASALVAIPTGVQIFTWLGTIWSGRLRFTLPAYYVVGFFVIFVIGGLTGVMLAVVPFDWQAHDTAFVTAHLHYVLMGGFVFPIIAGLYYWLPHLTRRERIPHIGELAFWLIFIGFNATFFLMHLVGLLGMPRRVATYPEGAGWTMLNFISSLGGFIMTIGFAVLALDILSCFLLRHRSARNCWGATTLEWAMPTPAAAYNFASIAHVASRDPIADAPHIGGALARGEGYLAAPRNNWRETTGVDIATGRLDFIAILPANSSLPIITALVTGAFFLSFLFKAYWFAPVALIGLIALGWTWALALGDGAQVGYLDAGRGAAARAHWEFDRPMSWWGAVFALCSDATLFASLLFGYAFLWTTAPNWPPPSYAQPHPWEALAILFGALVSYGCIRAAELRCLENRTTFAGGLCLAALVGCYVTLGGLIVIYTTRLPAPTVHAYAATTSALVVYSVVHTVLAMIFLSFAGWRVFAAPPSKARLLEIRIARLFVVYNNVTAGMTAAILLVQIWSP